MNTIQNKSKVEQTTTSGEVENTNGDDNNHESNNTQTDGGMTTNVDAVNDCCEAKSSLSIGSSILLASNNTEAGEENDVTVDAAAEQLLNNSSEQSTNVTVNSEQGSTHEMMSNTEVQQNIEGYEGDQTAHEHIEDNKEPNFAESEQQDVSACNEEETEDGNIEHTEYYEKLLEQGFYKTTAYEVEKLVAAGLITEQDLDERALSALKEFSVSLAVKVMKEFSISNLEHVVNKSAYLCGMMKTHRQRAVNQEAAGTTENKCGPDEEVLKDILARTGYSLDVTTGQRKYGGPPPDWEGSPPGPGHEVFVGKIPRDVFEDVLIPLFEKCGRIWDLRLMVDALTGMTRGYAFITFCEKDSAQEAVKQLNDCEVAPNKKIKVNVSVANVRLFAGNIPKQRNKEEIKEEFSKITEGLVDVIVYQKLEEPQKHNRGFCFLEYESHKHASAAKRKMSQSGQLKLWGCDIIIDWAEPLEQPSDEVMAQVKVLYVRGLTTDITEEMLQSKFEPYGKLERVKLLKGYGFVHFHERDLAVQAMNDLNGQTLGEATMEVTLAKPQTDKNQRMMRFRGGRGGHMQESFRGHGGPWGPPRGRGAPRGYGRGFMPGYHSHPRGGYHGGYGYDDYDYDYGYGGYGPPPPPMRGPPMRGRGGPPMPWRGPPHRAHPYRGGPPRGGFRGSPRGSSRGHRGASRGGGKRSAGQSPAGGADAKKPKRLMDQQAKWGTEQPIAQQPLGNTSGYQEETNQSDSQWYSDTW